MGHSVCFFSSSSLSTAALLGRATCKTSFWLTLLSAVEQALPSPKGVHKIAFLCEFCEGSPPQSPSVLPASPCQALVEGLAIFWLHEPPHAVHAGPASTNRVERATSTPSAWRYRGSVGARGWTSAPRKKPPQCSGDQAVPRLEAACFLSMLQMKLWSCMCALMYPEQNGPMRPSGSAMPPSALQSQAGSKAPASPGWSTPYKPTSRFQTPGWGAKLIEVPSRFWGHWGIVLLDCFLGLQSCSNWQCHLSRSCF